MLYGQDGRDSGILKLATSETHRDKFERGHNDRFKIEAIGLGDISKIRIGHDGTKSGAGWHLEKVASSFSFLSFILPV